MSKLVACFPLFYETEYEKNEGKSLAEARIF